MQIKKIMDSVGRVLSKEDLDEKTVEGFLDFLISLQVKSILVVIRETLAKGLGTVTRKFIGNKHICMSVLELFKSSINNDDGGKTSAPKLHWISFTSFFSFDRE